MNNTDPAFSGYEEDDMTREEKALLILKDHQKWRKGCDETPATNPKCLSSALDIAIKALEMAKGDEWMPIDEWSEEMGDVAIVFFDHKGELWDTLLSSPLSSDYPVHVNGLTGYFKRVNFDDLPQPPKSEE